MRVTKHQRQHRIAKLLEAGPVSNQAQLVELLAGEGVSATQTTVSRDLEELGAIKVRIPGGETAYALPDLPTQQIAPSEHLRRILGEWVVEVSRSGTLVLLRTPPGCAHVVASAIDRSGVPPVSSARWPETTPSWWSPPRVPAAGTWPSASPPWRGCRRPAPGTVSGAGAWRHRVATS